MEHTFFVANLGPNITDEQLQAFFTPLGTILESKVMIHPQTEKPTGAGMVRIESEASSEEITNQLNGQLVEDRRIAVSPAKPSFPLPKPTQEQRDLAKEIAAQLGETETAPSRQILRLVQVCSCGFSRTILAEALELEAAGGLMVLDGTRRRTQGGVFFYLARGRMSYDAQGAIFPRRKEKKKREAEKAARLAQQAENAQKQPKGEKKAKASNKKDQSKPNHQSEAQNAEPAGETISGVPPADLEALRSQLDELRQAHHAAQANLTALQAQKGKSMGTFSAIKQVVDLQRQIDELLRAYPQLK